MFALICISYIYSQSALETEREKEQKTGRSSLVDRHWQQLWMVAADGRGDENGKEKSGRGMMDRDRAEN